MLPGRPPATAATWPSSDVPVPKGTMGIAASSQMRTSAATSSAYTIYVMIIALSVAPFATNGR